MKTLITFSAGLLLYLVAVSAGTAQMPVVKPSSTPVKKSAVDDFREILDEYKKIDAKFKKKEKEYNAIRDPLEEKAAEIMSGRSKEPLNTVAVCKVLSELSLIHGSNFDYFDLMEQSESDIKDDVDLRLSWGLTQDMWDQDQEMLDDEDKLWGCGITRKSVKGEPGALVKPVPSAGPADRKQLEKEQADFDQAYKVYVEKFNAAIKIAGDAASTMPAQCTSLSEFLAASNALETMITRLESSVGAGLTEQVATAAELAAIKNVIAWKSTGFAQNKSNATKDLQSRSCSP